MQHRSPIRWTSLPLALLILIQSLLSTPVYALSGGPTQPEFQQPTTVGSDDMVDLFTGNFRYSIPLFEIGGYPINLSYSSDHGMEEEASWVGFGWTLNPGAISRQVRGLPDDFRGDEIERRGNRKANITTGVSPGMDTEIFGFFGLSAALNFSYNNYTGFDFTQDFSPSVNLLQVLTGSATRQGASTRANFSLSANFNSRAGLEGISWSAGQGRFNVGGSLYQNDLTYTPTAELPRTTIAQTFHFKAGAKPAWPVSLHGIYRGHFVSQTLKNKVLKQAGYGYLYLEEALDPAAVMDYNVEQGGLLNQDASRLPLPYGTPDVFSVTGSGLSGQLEISRADFQAFRPAQTGSSTVSVSAGGEAAPGDLIHVGVNIQASYLSARKGGWGNDLLPLSNPYQSATESSSGFRRPAYFRFLSDQTVETLRPSAAQLYESPPFTADVYTNVSHLALSGLAQRNPYQIAHQNEGDEYRLPSASLTEGMGFQPRATVVSYLTAEEARHGGLNRTFTRYSLIQNEGEASAVSSNGEPAPRVDPNAGRAEHHISELSVTTTAGQRYVYGLPVYNHLKREVTFSAAKLTDEAGPEEQGERRYGLISYSHNPALVSVNNKSGRDHYFDELTTGPHPIAHLLTAVLSPDYMDRTGDGPTLDDLGNYIKIGYSPLTKNGTGTDPIPAGYRTPLGPHTAILNEGNFADPLDDKASFSYGEKEIYYTHHMESKTHRAVFITSARDDANPVDEHGADSGLKLRKLDRIVVYTLAELEQAEIGGRKAVPVKTINFTYASPGSDGEISGNIPNAAEGKLTLQSVSFTYANNERGKNNPYIFTYKTEDANGDKVLYEPFMLDRWGMRKRRSSTKYLDPINYPFTEQSEEAAEKYCGVGNLTGIALPSGGTISIEYQPDDYAFVQQYRAGRMYRIADITSQPPNADHTYSNTPKELYVPDGTIGEPNLYIHIDIGEPAEGYTPDQWSSEEQRRRFLTDVEQIYFSAIIDILQKGGPEERVSGYSEFDEDYLQIIESNNRYYLILKLVGLDRDSRPTDDDIAIHPITYAGLDKLRFQMPQQLYGGIATGGSFNPLALLSILKQIGTSLQSFHGWRLGRANKNARFLHPASSFVRLAEPTFKKYGGGSRVSKISLSDEWQAGTKTYDKTYEYTTIDPVSNETISSGVASNEPMNGKEEMLMVNVGKDHHQKRLGPDRVYHMEHPAGLAFFPGPSVGYSRVVVRQYVDDSQYHQSKPGYTEHTFYTAKDFPVKVRMTPVDRAKIYPSPVQLPFLSRYLSRLGLSQGFSIEVNDMHGKPKGTYERSYDQDIISSTVYNYRTAAEDDNNKGGSLNNTVEVVQVAQHEGGKPTLNVRQAVLGVHTNIWMEHTYDEQISYGAGGQFNVDVSLPFLVAPVPFPDLTDGQSSLQTAAITKLISRKGILEEVTVTNNGSSLTTRNMRFDALTGVPLLTQTQNEYGQPIYQMSSPAYWMVPHTGMGPAGDRTGMRLEGVFIEEGVLMTTDQADNPKLVDIKLVAGDELVAYGIDGYMQDDRIRLFAVPYPPIPNSDNDQNESSRIVLIDENGTLVTAGAAEDGERLAMVLIRTGQRNMLTAPAEQTTALSMPDGTDRLFWRAVAEYTTTPAVPSGILSSSATEYSDAWGNLCEPIGPFDYCDICEDCAKCPDCPKWQLIGCNDGGGCDPDYSYNRTSFTPPDPTEQVRFDYDADCVECTVVSTQNWLKDIVEIRKDCDACIEIFSYYASVGWMPNVNNYAEVSWNATQQRYDVFNIKDNLVADCQFMEQNSTIRQFFGGRRVALTKLKTLQLFAEGYNGAVDSHTPEVNCNRTVPTQVDNCGGTTAPFAAMVLMENSAENYTSLSHGTLQDVCFPWHPQSNINPYLDGRRGNWRPKATYITGQTRRSYSQVLPMAAPDTDLRNNNYHQPLLHADGTLSSFEPFWSDEATNTTGGSYIEANIVTHFDEHGHELETKDALGIYSGAQYGFTQNIPLAVAKNARHTDIGFDGFEDYSYARGGGAEPWDRHFSLIGRQIQTNVPDAIVSTQAHTGRFSYRIAANASGPSVTYPVFGCDATEVYCPDEEGCGSCVNGFTPQPGKEYLASVWVATDESIAFGLPPRRAGIADENITPANSPYLRVSFDGGGQTVTGLPRDAIIEGWQQIQFAFTVPVGAENLTIQLRRPTQSDGQDYYFDDVRIQPYASEMTSYVYDYTTLRLMAQLDDRGYAVFYEYDDEGMLIRQKRETERGVMTITEQHTNLKPNDDAPASAQ